MAGATLLEPNEATADRRGPGALERLTAALSRQVDEIRLGTVLRVDEATEAAYHDEISSLSGSVLEAERRLRSLSSFIAAERAAIPGLLAALAAAKGQREWLERAERSLPRYLPGDDEGWEEGEAAIGRLEAVGCAPSGPQAGQREAAADAQREVRRAELWGPAAAAEARRAAGRCEGSVGHEAPPRRPLMVVQARAGGTGRAPPPTKPTKEPGPLFASLSDRLRARRRENAGDGGGEGGEGARWDDEGAPTGGERREGAAESEGVAGPGAPADPAADGPEAPRPGVSTAAPPRAQPPLPRRAPRRFISEPEMRGVPSYLRGRLSRDKVNAALEELAGRSEGVAAALVSKRAGASSTGCSGGEAGPQPSPNLPPGAGPSAVAFTHPQLATIQGVWAEARDELRGRFWTPEPALGAGSAMPPGRPGRALAAVLRHLGRILETRVHPHGAGAGEPAQIVYVLLPGQ